MANFRDRTYINGCWWPPGDERVTNGITWMITFFKKKHPKEPPPKKNMKKHNNIFLAVQIFPTYFVGGSISHRDDSKKTFKPWFQNHCRWGGRGFASLSISLNTEDSVASILEMAEARVEIHGFLAGESQNDSKSTWFGSWQLSFDTNFSIDFLVILHLPYLCLGPSSAQQTHFCL